MSAITNITAEEVRDSRGKPTIAVTVHTGESTGTFSVPSGASTGSAEACELRDTDGHMNAAIKNVVETVRPALVGLDVTHQEEVDHRLIAIDGTPNKSNLGGNVLIGVSIACAKAAAAAKNIPVYEHLRSCAEIKPSRDIPYLYSNYINGGKHASSPLSFQEHMLVPESESVAESVGMLEKIGGRLEEVIRSRYSEESARSAGDEGGYVIPESDPHVPFDLLSQAIAQAGFEGRVRIAIDVAASSFFEDGGYAVGGRSYSTDELAALYADLIQKYPIISIEDPFHEDAFDAFSKFQASTDTRVVGDDLTVTNPMRLKRAIESRSIRGIIIKPNQIGTLSEVFEAMKLARESEIDCIVSHRSGETMDDFIADLAYAFGAFGLKAGALRKKERRAKYERLAIISGTTI